MKLAILIVCIPIFLKGQSDFTKEIDLAYNNALKGVHYALSNIPDRKNSISKDLIDLNQLVAKVKLNKEVGGVTVESVGKNKTYEVKIIVQRDYTSLKEEGIIDRIPVDE